MFHGLCRYVRMADRLKMMAVRRHSQNEPLTRKLLGDVLARGIRAASLWATTHERARSPASPRKSPMASRDRMHARRRASWSNSICPPGSTQCKSVGPRAPRFASRSPRQRRRSADLFVPNFGTSGNGERVGTPLLTQTIVVIGRSWTIQKGRRY